MDNQTPQMGQATKSKKPLYKKWWFWVIIVVVIIGIFGAIGGGDDTASDTSTDKAVEEPENTANNEPVAEASEEKEKDAIGEIGKALKVGNVKYTVKSMKTASSVGDQYLGQEAKGIFVILDITIKNNGDKALDVSSSFFKLKLDDKEFEPDDGAGIYFGDKAMIYDKLNPDSKMIGAVIFDVTKKVAEDPDLILEVQTGVWGTEVGQISLKQ